jgi:hypothetical protein
MTLQARLISICAAALGLSACASGPAEEYPSLAIRDAERLSGTLEVEPYTPPLPAPAILASLEELTQTARAAHADFVEALPGVRRIVSAASSSPVGSEAWSNAQVAVGSLELRRSAAMIALAELDQIYVETSINGEALAPVEAVQEQVASLVAQQDAVINELVAALS